MSISKGATRIPISINPAKMTNQEVKDLVAFKPSFVPIDLFDINIAANDGFFDAMMKIKEMYDQSAFGENFLLLVVDSNIYKRVMKVCIHC